MKIIHFGAEEQCNTIYDYNEILNKRYRNDANEFWIHHDDSEYPCLVIVIKGKYAFAQYVIEEELAGFLSIGVDTDLNPKEVTVFYVNTVTEELEISNTSIISSLMAIKVANEFFDSPKLPKCIEWFNLLEE